MIACYLRNMRENVLSKKFSQSPLPLGALRSITCLASSQFHNYRMLVLEETLASEVQSLYLKEKVTVTQKGYMAPRSHS